MIKKILMGFGVLFIVLLLTIGGFILYLKFHKPSYEPQTNLNAPIEIPEIGIIKYSDEISDEKPMMSDLNGSFDIVNRDLKNINVYSKNKSLSMYIEGDYNIDKENSNIKLWGKYDKNERNKIRVLYIPLSAIMKVAFRNEHSMEVNAYKIKKIPPIQADSDDTEIFTVKLTGNPNNGKLKVQLRSIK